MEGWWSMGESPEAKTVAELAAMPADELIAYFTEHPFPGLDPRIDPAFVARIRAKSVERLVQRDQELDEARKNVLAAFPKGTDLAKVIQVGQALMDSYPNEQLLIDHRILSDGGPIQLVIYRQP